MKKQFAFLLACMLAVTLVPAQQPPLPPESRSAQQEQTAAQFPDGSAYTNSVLTYNIIDSPNNTFGYDVFVDGRLIIHQTSMPGLPGNDGFKTKDDAAKVAELVMYKIRKGEMSPTVSIEEMKNIGITK